MAGVVYLDTHVLVWLYAGERDLFPSRARRALEENELWISPVVELELQYLLEVKRIKAGPGKIIKFLQDAVGLKICSRRFDRVISESVRQKWTRDPFDRIIVAQARLAGAPLVTKDKFISKHYKNVIW